MFDIGLQSLLDGWNLTSYLLLWLLIPYPLLLDSLLKVVLETFHISFTSFRKVKKLSYGLTCASDMFVDIFSVLLLFLIQLIDLLSEMCPGLFQFTLLHSLLCLSQSLLLVSFHNLRDIRVKVFPQDHGHYSVTEIM